MAKNSVNSTKELLATEKSLSSLSHERNMPTFFQQKLANSIALTATTAAITSLITTSLPYLGCQTPRPPADSVLRCARGVGSCFVKCKKGHAFPDGARKSVLKCERGEWYDERAGRGQPIPGKRNIPLCTMKHNKKSCVTIN